MHFIHYLNIGNIIATLLLVGYIIKDSLSGTDTIPTGANTSATSQHKSSSPSVEQVFSDLKTPLNTVIQTKGPPNPELMPTTSEINDAIQSDDIHSTESQLVLKKYEEMYQFFDIPFPALTPPTQEQEEPKQVQKAEEQIILAYFQGQVMRLQRASEEQQIDITTSLPTKQEIQKAAQSGSIASPVSKVVIEKIQIAYNKLNIPYYPPVTE